MVSWLERPLLFASHFFVRSELPENSVKFCSRSANLITVPVYFDNFTSGFVGGGGGRYM